jgi:hypothetical protein
MTDKPRYVAVVERDGKVDETYVFNGSDTLDAIFEFINDRRVLGKTTGISVHLDQSTQAPWYERLNERPERPCLVEQS